MQWSLEEEEGSVFEAIDPDDLIRQNYDDEDIREMAEERVQKELDLLDAEIKEVDEKRRRSTYDDDLSDKLWDELNELQYKRSKLVDKAVEAVWDDL